MNNANWTTERFDTKSEVIKRIFLLRREYYINPQTWRNAFSQMLAVKFYQAHPDWILEWRIITPPNN